MMTVWNEVIKGKIQGVCKCKCKYNYRYRYIWMIIRNMKNM